MFLMPNNLGYYVIARDTTSSNYPAICQYLFSDTANSQWQQISYYYRYVYGSLLITNTQLLMFGFTNSSPYPMHMLKVTFGATSPDWANTMAWGSGTCSTYYSESLLSSDSTKIYSIFSFQNWNLYITSFNVTDGSVIGSRYKSSITWKIAFGSALYGDYIAASVTCGTSWYVLLYNISTSTFLIRLFSGATYLVSLETSSGR